MNDKKIAVLLPFKDPFTHSKAGSASIWIKDFNKNSLYKNSINIYGGTDNLKDVIDKKRYTNINFNIYNFKSKNLAYIDKFIELIRNKKFNLIEIHNRPSYIHHLLKKNISIKETEQIIMEQSNESKKVIATKPKVQKTITKKPPKTKKVSKK